MLIALLLQAAPAPPEPAAGDEVVVTARRSKCDLPIADEFVSNNEFKRRAAEWRPVHVVMPPDGTTKCMVGILFKLANSGVKNAYFDDPAPLQQ